MATSAAPLSRRTNRRAFIVAALFGVLAAFLTLVFLKNSTSQDTASVVTVPVVVASRDIPERTVIKEGMVEVKQVAADARHNLALGERHAAVGQVSRVPIAAGEQVLRNKVADQISGVGFSANIPQGKRGVAVGVTEVIASGGHIGVGDFVDVVGVFEIYDMNFKNPACVDCQTQPRRFTTVTVLQNIQVLAVAQADEPTIQSSSKDGDSRRGKASEVKSVTLAVTPEQAEVLFQSEELGKLRLSLRPFGEDERRSIPPIFNDPGNWPAIAVGQQ